MYLQSTNLITWKEQKEVGSSEKVVSMNRHDQPTEQMYLRTTCKARLRSHILFLFVLSTSTPLTWLFYSILCQFSFLMVSLKNCERWKIKTYSLINQCYISQHCLFKAFLLNSYDLIRLWSQKTKPQRKGRACQWWIMTLQRFWGPHIFRWCHFTMKQYFSLGFRPLNSDNVELTESLTWEKTYLSATSWDLLIAVQYQGQEGVFSEMA